MKRIALLSTGGTIAMKAGPDGMGLPSLGAAELVASVPALGTIAAVTGRDLMSGRASSGFTLDDLALILRETQAALKDSDGVVITHGTDTLEDTAFALSLLLEAKKPVVLTGALRRADMPGADGPANLVAACRVAASDSASGVLVVLNDEIHSGLYVSKSHSFMANAFTSSPGPLGWVAEDRVRIFLRPAETPPKLALGEKRPVIPLVETGFNFEKETVALLSDTSVGGAILNMTGVGHVSAVVSGALEKLAAAKPVIFASRAGRGETFRATYGGENGEASQIRRGLIPAGYLSGRQARMALALLLSDGADIKTVRDYFSRFSA